MNCRASEPLILAERDGVLTSEQHAALTRHLATCPACRQLRDNLAEAMSAVRSDTANVPTPDVEAEWRAVQAKINAPASSQRTRRRAAPIIWLSAPLAAAAAIALAFLATRSIPGSSRDAVAQADFVEVADPAATPIVYADQESGWLVVWAENPQPSSAAG